MGKKTANSEFPVLDDLQLYAASTKGDGNCLFRALSDQVFGDESHHKEIRQKVVEYTKEHGDHFAAFVGEFGETFDQYISRLIQDGVYGGHIEIVGFADRFSRPVVIYQTDTLYIVEPQNVPKAEWKSPVHIAYHTWEHYSSVRKIGGPRNGPVEISIPQMSDLSGNILSESSSPESSEVSRWKVEIVLRSVPDAEEKRVIEMLRSKDYDMVIEELIMEEFEDPPPDNTTAVNENAVVYNEPATQAKEDHSLDAEKKSGLQPGKQNKKQEAKQRRSDKKERLRAKKDKSKHKEIIAKTPLDEQKDPGISSTRVIHI